MTSADPIKTPPTRRGRRGRAGAAVQELGPGELERSLDELLHDMDDDISGVEVASEIVVPVYANVPDPAVTEAAPWDILDGARKMATKAGDLQREMDALGYGRPVPVGPATEPVKPTAGGRKYALIENGLVFEEGTTQAQWERDVLGLIAVKRRIDWALADALAYGEDRWGEMASQVLDATSFSVQTLYNLASVARKVPRELRNDTLPFTVQAEVASLERYEDKKSILEAAAEGSLKREEVRDLVRATKRARQREAADARPVPATQPPNIQVEEADARSTPWADGSIDLIVTSPPYGILDEERGEGVRKYDAEDDWREWADLMDDFCDEAYRILADGGRMAINVPFDTWVGGQDGGQRSTLGRVLVSAQAAGLRYVTLISWNEGNVSKSVARGSVDSASAPRVMNPQEAVVVFCKGQFNRLEAMKAGDLTDDITHEEWLQNTWGTWDIPGESRAWEGFEAAYPEELARRLIKTYSFQQDIVADPFSGSGTTAKVCWRLGRAGRFSDIDPKAVASTKRRLLA